MTPTFEPNRRLEVVGRVAVVVLGLTLLRGVFINDIYAYWTRAHGVGLHHLPYRDFLWEFPPLTTIVLPLIPLSRGSVDMFAMLFAAVMVAAEYGALEIVRRAHPDRARALTRWWTALMVPLGTLAYFRLDFLSVLPACVALVLLARRDRAPLPIVVGTLVKLWPGVLAVVLLAQRRWREFAVTALATGAAVAAWWAFSPSGFTAFLRFRRGSGVQLESGVGAVLHLFGGRPSFISGAFVVGGGGWGWVDPLATAVVAAVAAVFVLRSWRQFGRVDPLALSAGLLLLLLITARLFSPQYLVWVVPFVALQAAGGRHRRSACAFALAIPLTLVEIYSYADLVHGHLLVELVVVARNGLLIAATVGYLRAAWIHPHGATPSAAERIAAGAVVAPAEVVPVVAVPAGT